MFLQLIFRKLGIRENKFVLAIVYGCIYAVFTFLIFWLASLYLKQFFFLRYLIVSLMIGVVMCVVYLLKWEFLKLKNGKS